MTQSTRNGIRYTLGAAAIAVALVAAYSIPRSSAESGVVIPAPVLDPSSQAASEVVVLAGGCFWGVQGVFQHVKGVSNAVSGYAGGEAKTAHYDIVSGGRTGHAEAVKVTYD